MLKNIQFLPEQASTYAQKMDLLLLMLVALTAFFTILVAGLITIFAIRFRKGNLKVDRSNPVHHHEGLELVWTIIPMILGLGVFVWGAVLFASVRRPPANAREVFVIGKRWMWHIQHQNGIRENNELHVPVGEPVKLTMISQDVIHDFFVPAFRIHQDVIPGIYTTTWFQATKVGRYHLFCSQYCGTNHSEMVGWIVVMQPADFQKWLENGGSEVGIEKPKTMAQTGAELYQTLGCGNCHGEVDNARAPSLLGLYGRQRKLTDGKTVVADDFYVRESITKPYEKIVTGYAGTMPAYTVGPDKGQLTEEQVLQLMAHIKGPGTSGAPAMSKPLELLPLTAPQKGAATPPADKPIDPSQIP